MEPVRPAASPQLAHPRPLSHARPPRAKVITKLGRSLRQTLTRRWLFYRSRRFAVAFRSTSSLDEPDASPDLKHGVPGVQWNSAASAAAQRRPAPTPHSDEQESYALYLGLIFGVALVLRLLVVLMGPMADIEQAYTDQTPHQLTLADNLAAHHHFAAEHQPADSLPAAIDQIRLERGEIQTLDENLHIAENYASPGYPGVLSIFSMTGLPLTWLLLAQCLIGAGCTLLVYQVGRGLLERKAPAALAAVIVAIHPGMLVASATLAGDVLISALVLAALVGVASRQRRQVRGVFGSGVAVGVAALFSPIYLWLAPLLASWMVLTERRLHSVALAVVMLLGTAVPVGGWLYRNQQVGLPDHFSSQPAIDRLFGTAVAMQQPLAGPFAPEATQRTVGQFRDFALLPDHDGINTLTLLDQYGRAEVQADRPAHLQAIAAGARRLALDHSLDDAFARLGIEYTPSGYAANLLAEPVSASAASEPVLPYVINTWVGLNAALVAGMAIGAAMMLWHRRFASLILLLTLAGFAVYFSSSGGSEQLRLPVIAVQAMLVTATFAAAPSPRPKRQKKPKLAKLKKLDDEPTTRNSPLATPDSIRPMDGALDRPRLDPRADAAPATGSADDAIHPALRASMSENADRTTVIAAGGRPI